MKNLRTLVNDAYKEVLGGNPAEQVNRLLSTQLQYILSEPLTVKTETVPYDMIERCI